MTVKRPALTLTPRRPQTGEVPPSSSASSSGTGSSGASSAGSISAGSSSSGAAPSRSGSLHGQTLARCRRILNDVFGYDDFRGIQKGVIPYVSAGRDALVLMSTGGGKSLCYQIPALARPGLCVIVSPLIALMADQVEDLKKVGQSAASLTADTLYEDRQDIRRDILAGRLKFLYVAPERFASPDFLELLSGVDIALYAIDEAHCVSNWGHSFRQDYAQLGAILDTLPDAPRLAVTATADRITQEDIISSLHLREAETFQASFARPNIGISIELEDGKKERHAKILEYIRARSGQCGIVYCRSRNDVRALTEHLSTHLADVDIPVLSYHGDMSRPERQLSQDTFSQARAAVMVATLGFGMGINKSDIRYVCHHMLPENLEAYYQEIGRAGRDGEPAEAYALFSMQNIEAMFRHGNAGQSARAYKRFGGMLSLTEGSGCRQKSVLKAFGEKDALPCGRCDHCLNAPRTVEPSQASRQLALLLMTIDDCEPKSGLRHYVDVLQGKQTSKVMKNSADRCATFGQGAGYGYDYWSALLRYAMSENLAGYHFRELDSGIMVGHVVLSKMGARVLHNPSQLDELVAETPMMEPVILKQAKSRSNQRFVAQKLADDAPPRVRAVHDSLVAIRERLGEVMNRPPAMFIPDGALMKIATTLPRDSEEIRSILPSSCKDSLVDEIVGVISTHVAPQQERTGFALKGFGRR